MCAPTRTAGPYPVAKDLSVSHGGDAFPRVRIENDVLGKDEVLAHVCLASKTGLGRENRQLRDDRAATLKTRS
jgi:hypothetical protein